MTTISATPAEIERLEAELWRLRAVEVDLERVTVQNQANLAKLDESTEYIRVLTKKNDDAEKRICVLSDDYEAVVKDLAEKRERLHGAQREIGNLTRNFDAIREQLYQANANLRAIGEWFRHQGQHKAGYLMPPMNIGTYGSYHPSQTGMLIPNSPTSTYITVA